MVFNRFFGVDEVDTKYSFGELLARLHTSTEYLNGLTDKYNSKINPAERAAMFGKILFQMFRFQILEKKLVAAGIKMVASDINNAPNYFLKNPQARDKIEDTYDQLEKNLNAITEEQSRSIPKSHYLRLFARNLVGRARSSKKKLTRNIAGAQEELTAKQVAEANIQETGLKTSGKEPYTPQQIKRRLAQLKKMQEKELAAAGRK